MKKRKHISREIGEREMTHPLSLTNRQTNADTHTHTHTHTPTHTPQHTHTHTHTQQHHQRQTQTRTGMAPVVWSCLPSQTQTLSKFLSLFQVECVGGYI